MATYNASEKEKKDTAEYDQKRATGADQTNKLAAQNTLGKIQNYGPFEYDINGDALYQQYKDQHIRQGNLAAQDIIGKASTMTGGYGNSYAQQVGQQTFNGYLQTLNDKIPELYALAYDMHNQGLNNLYNQYNLENNAYLQDYGEHMDYLSLLGSDIDRERSQNWNKTNLQAQNEANAATVTAAQIKADAEANQVNEMSPAEFIELISYIDAMRTDGGWDKDTASQFLLGYAAQNGITGNAFNPILNLFDWGTGWRDDYRTNMSELARKKQSK